VQNKVLAWALSQIINYGAQTIVAETLQTARMQKHNIVAFIQVTKLTKMQRNADIRKV
jgi:hypothetical protein